MMSDANGNQSPGEMNHIRERMVALQRSASNLAQLDLDALANLLPPGTSREQLAEIKSKLIQLHELQNRRHGLHAENDNSLASIDGVNGRSSRYKTELCRPFEENGVCKYGARCQFAHGVSELRNLARHPKYKSQLCRTFHSNGLCPYGHRCHFIHNQDEARTVARPIASSFPGARDFADLNMNHFRRNDAYSEFQFGELSRRASISDLSSETFQKQITNSLMQSFFPRFTADSRAANERPIPFAMPPLNNFKPPSNGCSLGSAGELSPPVSPIVYSSDDAFPPQIAGRQGFFTPGVLNDSTELNLNQMLGLSRFPVPGVAPSPHANAVSEKRAPHATEDSHVSASRNIPAPWWSGASDL